MVRKLAPVGQGAGMFRGVETQRATTEPASSSRRQPALNDAQRALIVSKYVDGWTVREVAAHVGRSYGTVHRVLQEQGVTMRGRNGR
jgi:DNA-directed RNA polymerase specialized sigma24 family protein